MDSSHVATGTITALLATALVYRSNWPLQPLDVPTASASAWSAGRRGRRRGQVLQIEGRASGRSSRSRDPARDITECHPQ
jgi:hypothetical protein